ncbi:MAG: hypothetical protein B7Z40_00875, partial [Bosea sp. 12-68-7]
VGRGRLAQAQLFQFCCHRRSPIVQETRAGSTAGITCARPGRGCGPEGIRSPATSSTSLVLMARANSAVVRTGMTKAPAP